LDLEAKRLIVEADYSEDENLVERNHEIATYLYVNELSDHGYKALKLPKEFRDGTSKEDIIPEKILLESLNNQLGDDYFDLQTEEGMQQFKEADAKFKEGREANGTGDKYSLNTVFYTISLFFGGVSLVFKTRMRWGFWAVGLIAFVVSFGFMLKLPRADVSPPAPSPAVSASAKAKKAPRQVKLPKKKPKAAGSASVKPGAPGVPGVPNAPRKRPGDELGSTYLILLIKKPGTELLLGPWFSRLILERIDQRGLLRRSYSF
jgi:hypothetical protein